MSRGIRFSIIRLNVTPHRSAYVMTEELFVSVTGGKQVWQQVIPTKPLSLFARSASQSAFSDSQYLLAHEISDLPSRQSKQVADLLGRVLLRERFAIPQDPLYRVRFVRLCKFPFLTSSLTSIRVRVNVLDLCVCAKLVDYYANRRVSQRLIVRNCA